LDHRALGLAVAILGAAIIVVGALIATGALAWFGRLPGDIRIEGERVRIYIPIASMLLVSVALSLALYVLNRLLGGR
jgi:DUF2905 family protein